MKLIGPSTHRFVSDAARLLCQSLNQEFDDLLDCIWKFNEQIPELWNIELAKLDSDTPLMRESRVTNESRKLRRSFPLFLNYSFASTSHSLLEVYLKQICSLVREHRNTEGSWRDMKGSPTNIIGKAYLYLEQTCDMKRADVPGFTVVETMGLVRHCVAHVAGYLDGYTKRELLEQRVAQQHKAWPGVLIIRDSADGPRLWFGLEYTQLSSAYCRGFLNELFVKVGLATPYEREQTISALS